MENKKKRSPRSNNKSPGATIFPKSPLVYESYKSGCGLKLINLFGFGHVKTSNKRLNSEKKFIRDSAGNVYTKSQIDLLKRLHENCHCANNEEEISCKTKTRRSSLSSEREDDKYESKHVGGLLEREIQRIKNLKEETFDKQSCSSETEKTNDEYKQTGLKNVRDCKKRAEINLQVRVNEAAETLICSKEKEEKGKDRSKQFMEALDILSSNKELFITLLQDPYSFSARKGKGVERSQVKEPRDESLALVDDLDEVVLLKPRLSSSVDDRMYLRFKHLAKKLKLVGSNKENNHREYKPECSGLARETEAATLRTCDVSTSKVEHRIPESPVFRRKKRVESDVFKLSMENDVLPRRLTVERQQERSNMSPVYEVPNSLSSLQTKLKERRQKLERRRESFKLWSLDQNLEVFDPKPHISSLKSLNNSCTSSSEDTTHIEDRYLESSLTESSSSLERPDSNIHDSEQEQEQPSPVSVLERTHMKNVKSYKLEEQIGVLSYDDSNMDLAEKDSVQDFVKKVLEASRLNWTNLMARCSEETSLLDEYSHSNHNNAQLLLVLDYTDEVLRGIYHQDIKFWPFTPSKSSRLMDLPSSLVQEDLIHETMRRFDWSLLCRSCDSPTRTLDHIIENDMVKPCLWFEFGGESEAVVSEVVEKILQQFVLEISHELRAMQRRRICGFI